MLAFVLLFAVAFAEETTVTCDAGKYQKLNDAQDGCVCMEGFTGNTGEDKETNPCVCTTENYHIINKTGTTNVLSYACEVCQAPNDKYDTEGMRCYEEASCVKPGQKVNMDKCDCDDSKNYVTNEDTATATDKPCVCKANHHEETSGTTKVCKADAVCNKPGQTQKQDKSACECTVEGFTVNTGEDKDTKPCVCATDGQYIINKTGTTNVLSYACEVCQAPNDKYDTTGMRCYKEATCDKPGQKVNMDKCECTVEGYKENTVESEKETKPCVCDTANGYENTAKEGETMKCEKKAEQTEEEKCKGVKGQEWKDNQCVCDTANGFENKETGKEKPINCGCKEAGHNIIKETKDNTTSYKCAKCEDKEKYDENEMKCIKSGVNGFFLLLAMALFFLF